MSKKQPEYELQKSICKWLDLQHPKLLYLSDTIASVTLTFPQQVRNKAIQKNGFKCPDLLILEPNDVYHGLFIELKVKSPYKKDGTLFKDDHLKEQQKTIKELSLKGYYSCFSWDFEMTINIINEYLNNYK